MAIIFFTGMDMDYIPCLSVHGVKLWNTLPDDIKNCTRVNKF